MLAYEMQVDKDYLVTYSEDSVIKEGDRIRILKKGDILEKSGRYIISAEFVDQHLNAFQVELLVPNEENSI